MLVETLTNKYQNAKGGRALWLRRKRRYRSLISSLTRHPVWPVPLVSGNAVMKPFMWMTPLITPLTWITAGAAVAVSEPALPTLFPKFQIQSIKQARHSKKCLTASGNVSGSFFLKCGQIP